MVVKKRGFKFSGANICYAHLQASGFTNDHLTTNDQGNRIKFRVIF